MVKRLLLTIPLLLTLCFAVKGSGEQVNDKCSATTRLFLKEMADRLQHPQRAACPSETLGDEIDLPPLIAAPENIEGTLYVSAFIRLSNSGDTGDLEALGVRVRSKFANGLITALLPVDMIDEIASIGNVKRINVASAMQCHTYKARQATNTDDVLSYSVSARSAGLPNSYDGSGVLIGVIDAGIDYQHVAFKDKYGDYRAVGAYVVKADSANNVTRTEYTKATMDEATTDLDSFDHGTHTSSIAGGSSVIIDGDNVEVTDNHAMASYGGMAPGADLYLAGVGATVYNTDFAESFEKIINAAAPGQPIVVSNSWGLQTGPHDGTGEIADVVATFFGDDHPNRICLFAAANYGGMTNGGYHVGGRPVSRDNTLKTVLCSTYSSHPGYMYYGMSNFWPRTEGVTDFTVSISVIEKDGNVVTSQSVVPTHEGALVDLTGYYRGTMMVYTDYEELSTTGKTSVNIYCEGVKSRKYTRTKDPVTGEYNYESDYYLAVEIYPTEGSVIIDGWGDMYFSDLGLSGYTNGDENMIVSDEATIAEAISVGAYVSNQSWTCYDGNQYFLPGNETTGDIASFSSWASPEYSPTGEQYPWITAPGAQVVSAVNHYSPSYITGYYNKNRVNTDVDNPYGATYGTSMSTPVAAGIVALWLQLAKDNGLELTTTDIKTVMKESAIHDSFTDGPHASHFGNGKIDALAGIKYILDNYVVNNPGVATAIDSPSQYADVKSVRYFNLFGVELREPASGFNIVITEHTDGSVSTSKVRL